MAEDPTSTKCTWVIKDFSLGSHNTFKSGAFRWSLWIGKTDIRFKLELPDFRTLPCGWRKDTRFKIVIVNRIDKNRTITKEGNHIFSASSSLTAYKYLIQRSHLCDASSGFIVNDSLVVEVEIVACNDLNNFSENIKQVETPKHGTKSATIKYNKEVVEEQCTSLKKARLHEVLIDSCRIESENPMVNVDGFNVPASRQEVLRLIFKKHPDVFSNFHFQNHGLRSTCMNELLKIIGILCRSPDQISQDDFHFMVTGLTDFKKAGLKVEWLENKVKDVSERMIKVDRTRTVELRKQIEEMKLEVEETMKKIKNVEALLEEYETEAESARIPLSLDDIV